MTILAISDVESTYLSISKLKERFPSAKMIISCGDLPFDYLDHLADHLNVPLYYVMGNHQTYLLSDPGKKSTPTGGINISNRTLQSNVGLLLAGFQGSIRYNYGPNQFTQMDMWLQVLQMIPHLWMNKIRFGRYLDILVTHAPAWKIQDRDDLPHQGFKAFNWLISTYHPALHLHGHIHIFRNTDPVQTRVLKTLVINTCGWREIEVKMQKDRKNINILPEMIRKGL